MMSAMPMPMPMNMQPQTSMMGGMPMMMNGMGMMPMNPMMMGGMNPMMMNGMGMMPGMGMGMMPMMMGRMMMPMMCRMSCEMTKDGMVCKMMPMGADQMERMKECCDAMNAMMGMGAPMMMVCNGMPMVMGSPG